MAAVCISSISMFLSPTSMATVCVTMATVCVTMATVCVAMATVCVILKCPIVMLCAFHVCNIYLVNTTCVINNTTGHIHTNRYYNHAHFNR